MAIFDFILMWAVLSVVVVLCSIGASVVLEAIFEDLESEN